MFKYAGTFQASFTVVNVFLLSESDFGVSCMETSNTCESAFTEGQCLPTFTTQDIYCVCLVVYFCLLLPLTVLTSSCSGSWDRFFFYEHFVSLFFYWQSFTYLCSHPKLVNESVNSSARPDITDSWILLFVFAVVFKHAVYFPILYINLYCTFQQQCI
jgi:hypothetical protein